MGLYTTTEQAAAPSTPASGSSVLYPKSDGLWYWKDDSGVEHAIVGDGSEITGATLNNSVAKGTWTTSGTWTLPALTLGGNVASTGNPSLNLGTGPLTAGATSVTTLTASGASTLGNAAPAAVDGGVLFVGQTGSGATSQFYNVSSARNTIISWNGATSGDNAFIDFGTEGTYTARGSITYNRGGGVVAYNTTSDYRAKNILGPLEGAGTTIDQLQVYLGQMKGATISRPMMIAHEAQAVVPYAVTGTKDAVDSEGKPIYQTMDHQILVPLLIAEVQALRARVAALES